MGLKILISIILYGTITPVHAFRTYYDNFLDDPNIVNIIVVGRLFEDKSGNQYIVPELGWSEYPSKLDVPSRIVGDNDFQRVKQGLVGQKYFFIMNNISPRKDKYFGLHTLVPLASSKRAMKLLAERKAFPGEINHAWRYCESDNDCLQVENKCGNRIGVNKKYKKEFLSFLKTTKNVFDCSTKDTPLKKSQSKCEEYFCE